MEDTIFFIDTNKYLDLYRTKTGKKLLPLIRELSAHIFITKQVVAEVVRNRRNVALHFIKTTLESLKLKTYDLPEHFSSTSSSQRKGILDAMKDVSNRIEQLNRSIDDFSSNIMSEINCSEDLVSKTLETIFSRAIDFTVEEYNRAKIRKELGNPPGKGANAIGDELHWEQILTNFKGKKKLWLVTNDGDFAYFPDRSSCGLLNEFLYRELREISDAPIVYVYRDLSEALEAFVKETGIPATTRLSPKDLQECRDEEQIRLALDTQTVSSSPFIELRSDDKNESGETNGNFKDALTEKRSADHPRKKSLSPFLAEQYREILQSVIADVRLDDISIEPSLAIGPHKMESSFSIILNSFREALNNKDTALQIILDAEKEKSMESDRKSTDGMFGKVEPND